MLAAVKVFCTDIFFENNYEIVWLCHFFFVPLHHQKEKKMKSYTDLEQSKALAGILTIESADCFWDYDEMQKFHRISWFEDGYNKKSQLMFNENNICAWSLAALLEELNRNCWKVSLKCCGAEWDMTYDDGERYISVSADNSVDACFEMIIKLHKLNLL